jgi:hypothetical protein
MSCRVRCSVRICFFYYRMPDSSKHFKILQKLCSNRSVHQFKPYTKEHIILLKLFYEFLLTIRAFCTTHYSCPKILEGDSHERH